MSGLQQWVSNLGRPALSACDEVLRSECPPKAVYPLQSPSTGKCLCADLSASFLPKRLSLIIAKRLGRSLRELRVLVWTFPHWGSTCHKKSSTPDCPKVRKKMTNSHPHTSLPWLPGTALTLIASLERLKPSQKPGRMSGLRKRPESHILPAPAV